jgi:hypothetical protein
VYLSHCKDPACKICTTPEIDDEFESKGNQPLSEIKCRDEHLKVASSHTSTPSVSFVCSFVLKHHTLLFGGQMLREARAP